MKKVVFAGTFNPFTIGHKAIVERGLALADEVVVAIGYNENKPEVETESRLDAIRKVFAGNSRVEVAAYSGLTADFARSIGADALLRGVRNLTDFEYEKNLADINRAVLGIETILLVADPDTAMISSSTVRELKRNGYDVSRFLP